MASSSFNPFYRKLERLTTPLSCHTGAAHVAALAASLRSSVTDHIMAVQATRAYLHAEADIEAALSKAGFKVVQKDMTATR